MSLKENIDMVKQELNSEEKFFEQAVKTEKFVKKYKNLLIGSVVIVVIAVAANIAYDISKQNRLDAVNAALLKLQKDSTLSAESTELKSLSPELYDVWQYSLAVVNKDANTLKSLSSSKALLVDDLASYEVAQSSQDASSLNSYAMKQDAIYKDLALVQAAILLLNDKKIDEAREKLNQVNSTSPMASVAKALLHYGVK